MFMCVLCNTLIEGIDSTECPGCHNDPISGERLHLDLSFAFTTTELAENKDIRKRDVYDHSELITVEVGGHAGMFGDTVARAMGVSEDDMDLVAASETAREAVLV